MEKWLLPSYSSWMEKWAAGIRWPATWERLSSPARAGRFARRTIPFAPKAIPFAQCASAVLNWRHSPRLASFSHFSCLLLKPPRLAQTSSNCPSREPPVRAAQIALALPVRDLLSRFSSRPLRKRDLRQTLPNYAPKSLNIQPM